MSSVTGVMVCKSAYTRLARIRASRAAGHCRTELTTGRTDPSVWAERRATRRQCAVDNIVGRVDVRDDVAQFARADIVPVLQRPLRIVGAVSGVAQHTAHQAQVSPTDVMAVLSFELNERLNIELELALVRMALIMSGNRPCRLSIKIISFLLTAWVW